MELKSNWLNNDDSLNMKLFYDEDLRRKDSELLAKETTNFDYHSKYMVAYSKLSYRDITSLSFNYADFPPLSSKTFTVSSFNSLQSSKLSRNSNFSTFTQQFVAKSVVKSNNSLFPLGTTSTQNSYFSPIAHKTSDASALVKNASSFSSNSDNSLVSRASLAICKANSNPQSNLVFKDHSKSHVLLVSVKLAIPVQYLFQIFVFSRASLAICQANSNPLSNLVFKDHSKSHVLLVSVKLAIPGQYLFLIFVFLPRFPILVMLWFKNLVLILTYLSLVLPQIQLHNVFLSLKILKP